MRPQEIRDRMELLEHTPDRERNVGEALADILGVPFDENMQRAFLGEVRRAQVLCRTHYSPRVAVLPDEATMATALLQGVTFAVAVLSLADEALSAEELEQGLDELQKRLRDATKNNGEWT